MTRMGSAMAQRADSPWYHAQIQPFLDYLRAECGLASNTAAAYGRDLKRFSAFCAEHRFKDPDSLTPIRFQQFARRLSEAKLASSSVARHLSAVKMFFRFLVLIGQAKRDRSALVESPKTWQRLPKVLPREKTVDLITAVDPNSQLALRDRALMELLYATGMRAAEVAGIKIGDVNFQIGYLRCLGKGEKERVIPIHRTALDACEVYMQELRPDLLREKKSDILFLSRTGRALSRIEVWRIVRRCAVQAGLKGHITPHTLRHCFGSHLLAGGADLRAVQELLGHADVATTQIYTHVDSDRLRSAHRQFHPRP